MRTKTIRQWSYEDVRLALQQADGNRPITGIKIANETGFIVEECPAADQPRSPKDLVWYGTGWMEREPNTAPADQPTAPRERAALPCEGPTDLELQQIIDGKNRP